MQQLTRTMSWMIFFLGLVWSSCEISIFWAADAFGMFPPSSFRATGGAAFSTRRAEKGRYWVHVADRAGDIDDAMDQAATTTTTRIQGPPNHVVDGVVCREIPIEVPVVGTVTVLEATAEAQESLVDMALALDEDDLADTEQKLVAGDPYGAVLWPAAWAVAKYLLTEVAGESKASNPAKPLMGLSILELGTGTGLVSIAAWMGGATVLATDYEPLALALTQYAARKFQPKDAPAIETQLLDMCDYGTKLPAVDIVVAADIMYEAKTGVAMAHRVVEALKQGSRVIVGDSPGRPGRPAFLETLRELGISSDAVFIDKIGQTCSGPRHELICGKGSTSVSETPQELPVAVMDLKPSMLTQ